MKPVLDETHDPAARSWFESANAADSDFPMQNLPFGIFRKSDVGSDARVGVAIGDFVLDVAGLRTEGLLQNDAEMIAAADACEPTHRNLRDVRGTLASSSLGAVSLNALMGLDAELHRALRRRLFTLLRDDASSGDRQAVSLHLLAKADVEMLLPAVVRDYTDFYA